MKNIYFLSAADRLNYGDLLFPLIFSKLSNNKDINFQNYGLVKNDFSSFGALKTKSYKTLQRDINNYGGNPIIGGWEALFPTWTTLYTFINPVFSKLMSSYKLSKLDQKLGISKNY